jgi:hypothetical protein
LSGKVGHDFFSAGLQAESAQRVLDGLTVGHGDTRKRKKKKSRKPSSASPSQLTVEPDVSGQDRGTVGQWRGGGLKRWSLVNWAKSPQATKPRERNLL